MVLGKQSEFMCFDTWRNKSTQQMDRKVFWSFSDSEILNNIVIRLVLVESGIYSLLITHADTKD